MSDHVVNPLPAPSSTFPLPTAGPFSDPPLAIVREEEPFTLTYAQAMDARADALLNNAIAHVTILARKFDQAVVTALETPAFDAGPPQNPNDFAWYLELANPAATNDIRLALMTGRRLLEDSGYRASASLLASAAHFDDLYRLSASDELLAGPLLTAGNISSVDRVPALDASQDTLRSGSGGINRMLMIGRMQEIPPGGAGDATAGEEPVDLAVAVPPSLEVIGDDTASNVQLAVRIAFATRVKDARGVVVFHS
jgi:hypothetical protein